MKFPRLLHGFLGDTSMYSKMLFGRRVKDTEPNKRPPEGRSSGEPNFGYTAAIQPEK